MKQSRSVKTPSGKSTSPGRKSQTRVMVNGNGKALAAKTKGAKTDDVQYVLPLGNGWVVKASKAKVFTAITDSKTEAISIARTLARTKQTGLIVHGKNGAVEIRESYSV